MGVEPMSESSREEGVGGDDTNMTALLWNLLSVASFVLCKKISLNAAFLLISCNLFERNLSFRVGKLELEKELVNQL